jgi:hypothetical protein
MFNQGWYSCGWIALRGCPQKVVGIFMIVSDSCGSLLCMLDGLKQQ